MAEAGGSHGVAGFQNAWLIVGADGQESKRAVDFRTLRPLGIPPK